MGVTIESLNLYQGRARRGLRRAGKVAAETLAWVTSKVGPGITTAAIDQWVREDTARRGGTPSQLGYHGFPAAVCTSPNEVVCHGIPSTAVRLAPGDILNVDVTTGFRGFHGDTSRMVAIGTLSPEAEHVVLTARRCRDAGIAAIRVGAPLGIIADAITELAHAEGCSVVEVFGGHGIGRAMHEPPHVPCAAPVTDGPRLMDGMCLTVEPMINLGSPDIRTLADGWTVVTADGRLSAQFEHTVLVTSDGPEILTLPPQ